MFRRWLLGIAAAATTATAHAAPDPADRGAAGGSVTGGPLAASACARLDERLGSVTPRDCELAALAASGHRSTHGHPLLVRDFPPAPGPAGARRVLLIGGIHGDELSSVSIVFHWIRELARGRARDIHWRVIPCMNPDGVLQSPPLRYNARGVDLNRNFPTPDWEARAARYWVDDTGRDPRRYPGSGPQSEPETQWLVEEIRNFRPDAVVSVHAPYGILDFDGPREPPRNIAFLDLRRLGTYPGSLGNYAGVHLGLPVLTLELPEAYYMPSATQVSAIWRDLVKWIDRNVKPSTTPALPGTTGRAQLGADQ